MYIYSTLYYGNTVPWTLYLVYRHWSSNINVLWSCLTSLFSSCCKYGKKFRFSKLFRKVSAVVVTIICICKNGHEGILFLLREYSLLETPFPK